jgi:hypothetical protein
MEFNGDPRRPEDGEERMPLTRRLLDLSVSPEVGRLLLAKRWQAVVRVRIPEEFRAQDDLRQEIFQALANRSALPKITDESVTIGYLVASAGDEDRDAAVRFAHTLASFVKGGEGDILCATVAYIDTTDFDHLLTLPELQPERYDDIKHL